MVTGLRSKEETTYPYLWIATHYCVDYGDVLSFADYCEYHKRRDPGYWIRDRAYERHGWPSFMVQNASQSRATLNLMVPVRNAVIDVVQMGRLGRG